MYLFHTTEQALRFPTSAAADRAGRDGLEADHLASWGVVLASVAPVAPSRPAPARRAPHRAATGRAVLAEPACAVARG
ncbi:hypothetical protein [Auraticoccus monumenti]|uniref:Uncharacterized protein n=1 Tax=Auraticoccus monumenti TaxID=675864 RepID=A0A1G6WWK2_9ACTN|nr:hypothetical protein [Auraticoccus monumenti]SDD70184.1 hypothetical protein SAMN04489747_1547 [Auraticoccus monumenti]